MSEASDGRPVHVRGLVDAHGGIPQANAEPGLPLENRRRDELVMPLKLLLLHAHEAGGRRRNVILQRAIEGDERRLRRRVEAGGMRCRPAKAAAQGRPDPPSADVRPRAVDE